MRVLTVSLDVPWPSVGGARTRNAALISALARRHDVTVVSLAFDDAWGPVPEDITLRATRWEQPPWSQSDEPYGVQWYDVPAFSSSVAEVGRRLRPHVAVLTETAAARFADQLPAGTPWVLDLHDVHAVKQRRYDAEHAEALRRFEAAAAQRADVTACVSEQEAETARQLLSPRRLEVVPNGVDLRKFAPGPGAGSDDRVVFTGSLHTAENVEGAVWFVEQVLPLIHLELPGIVVDLVGSRPAPEVQRLAGRHVRVHADVQDTAPYLHEAGVAVVPLLHGGGTRLKALEAAACRRAVVGTPVGVAGLTLGDAVETATAPVEFAAAVVDLLRDRVLREARAARALDAVRAYDWERIGRHWCDVVESVA